MPDILHFLAADDVWTWSDKRVIAHRIRQIRAQYRHLVQIVLVGLTKKMNNPNRVAINYIIEINCQLSLACLFDHDNTPCYLVSTKQRLCREQHTRIILVRRRMTRNN